MKESTEIIVAGRLHVAQEARETYLEACKAVVQAARDAPGCLDFALSADLLDPSRINVYERWVDRDSLERFRGEGPSTDLASRIVEADVVERTVTRVADRVRPPRVGLDRVVEPPGPCLGAAAVYSTVSRARVSHTTG